jgi:membrane fusion protein, multidrug efflux system
LAAAGHFGWDYWTTGRFEVTTNNAYVKADNTTIAPKVSGYLSAVLVGDNDLAQAGQVLARIDDRDFRVALLQAEADVAATRATITSKQAAIDSQQSVIEVAQATIAADEAEATFAEQED